MAKRPALLAAAVPIADMARGWITARSAAATRSISPSSLKSFIRKPTEPKFMP